MTLQRLFFLAVFLAACAADAAENVTPEALPQNRYGEMAKRSPFAPATATATPPPAISPFSSIYVTGMVRMGESLMVTFVDRSGDPPKHFLLSQGDKTPDGIVLEKVEWSDEIGKGKATLKKGEDVGDIIYDQAVQQKAAAAGGAPMAMPAPQNGFQPNMGQQQNNGSRFNGPNNVPRPIAPGNRQRFVAPSNAPAPAIPGPPNQPVIRHRTRIIQNAPQNGQ